MALSKILNDLDAGRGKFKDLDKDVQIAIYQKLLYKAGETSEGSDARKALKSVDDVFKELHPEVQKGIEIERQRYATAKANAIYQDYLNQKVLEKVVKSGQGPEIELQENLLFDPQGRLVYELTLSEDEQKEVLRKIEDSLGKALPPEADHRSGNDIKEGLKKVLGGRTPTDTTLCSIDLSGREGPDGHKDLWKKLRNKFVEKYDGQPLLSHQRASMVASFEESYAHLCLMARTFEGAHKNENISPKDWKDIRDKAALELQKEVAKAYKEAVKKATDSEGKVDLDKLNKNLAKERVNLAQSAKKELIKGVVAHLKDQDMGRKEILEYMQGLNKSLDKHSFTAQTATGYDYFYTSNHLQQGMLITGTKNTAHDKPEFKDDAQAEHQAAFRRVTYTYRDENGVLHPTSAVSARVPSPALVFDGKSDEEIRKDLVGKFGYFHDQMRAMRGGKEGPAVESLFTSIHSEAFERIGDSNNRQRTSALYMMQAMHEFNAQQYKNEPQKNNFLYVQNIGTNRHTRNLGYRDDRGLLDFNGSVELDDITLSAEMAMLHTLQENSAFLSEKVKKEVVGINTQVLACYSDFLKKEPREKYFADSPEGKTLIKLIRDFKKDLKVDLAEQEKNQDLPSLASNALARMIATNQHWDPRYGQLSQALSMYIEWASTGGCKSGNERNQDVMLRFALLKSIHERVEHNDGKIDKLQKHEQAIYTQLQDYAKGLKSDPDELRAAIAVSVKKSNLHGGAAAISREDQGGAAKVSSFSFVQDIKNPFLRWTARIALGVAAVATFPLLAIPQVRKFYVSQLIDTNNAADREMNLDATGASKTQAHKGQDKKTSDAIFEVLEADPLFDKKQGGQKLTKEEKAGFKKDKKTHNDQPEPRENVVQENVVGVVFNGGPQTMVKGLHVEAANESSNVNEKVLDSGKDHKKGVVVPLPQQSVQSDESKKPETPEPESYHM